MNILKTLFAVALALMSGWHSPANAARDCPIYPYETTEVTLTGRIIVERLYRLPQYDEDPNRKILVGVPILKLDKPISTLAGPDGPGHICVQKLQLASSIEPGLWTAKERRATMRGYLFAQITAHHHTRVLLMVEDVQFLEAAP
ncbi:DUF4431 domain-containing protein [Ferrovibrio sp.]|uniref:DUF4431 domain-containing protein n=1 Tax=Ferrovibrio sp. TaxID=1917215 RepID=UPI0035AE37FC